MTFKWTPQNVQKLTKMLAKGMSARQIAEDFGVTRNSVIGKANRLGLSVQAEKKAKASSPAKAEKPKKAPAKVKREIIHIAQPTSPTSESACQWPIGDPGTPEFKFCYEPAKAGRPYCEEHCDIAYRKTK